MNPSVISPSKQVFLGKGYWLMGRYYQRRIRSDKTRCGFTNILLHRVVWEHHHGKPPAGKNWHIHHKDGNRSNNNIDNLELIEGSEHSSNHMTPERRFDQAKAMIAYCHPVAAAWHRSEAGRVWHRQMAAERDAKRAARKAALCR